MKEELFSELVEVGRKGEPFFAAQKQPARMAVLEAPDMAAIRGDYGLSQTKSRRFSESACAPFRTGNKDGGAHEGRARVLLKVACHETQPARSPTVRNVPTLWHVADVPQNTTAATVAHILTTPAPSKTSMVRPFQYVIALFPR